MDKAAEKEKAKRAAAKAKLEARREKLARLQKKELEEAGVPPEVSAEIVAER